MTSRPKVYISRKIPDEAVSIIESYCDYTMWDREDVPVPRDVFLDSVSHVDGILTMLTESVSSEVFISGPNIKVVANMAVGYDNIDVIAANNRGIVVTNTPDVLTETTADLTFGLLLAASRRIVEASECIKQGNWSTWSPMFLTGVDIYGKTIGIIGMGRIGQAVARRALGFNMKVQYYARTKKNHLNISASYVPLQDLLKTSDFVCVLTPLTSETKHLLSAREFSLMKPSAVLVNTSRGPVVDESALFDALTNRQIWAAALDVFEQEPISQDHPLVRLPNTVVTPHIGSASIETRTKMAVLAAKNLVAVLTGRSPTNRVV